MRLINAESLHLVIINGEKYVPYEDVFRAKTYRPKVIRLAPEECVSKEAFLLPFDKISRIA